MGSEMSTAPITTGWREGSCNPCYDITPVSGPRSNIHTYQQKLEANKLNGRTDDPATKFALPLMFLLGVDGTAPRASHELIGLLTNFGH